MHFFVKVTFYTDNYVIKDIRYYPVQNYDFSEVSKEIDKVLYLHDDIKSFDMVQILDYVYLNNEEEAEGTPEE